MIQLGTFVDHPPDSLKITSDDRELRPHLKTPWIREWIAKELGINDTPVALPSGPAVIDPHHLKKHALIVGKAGFGKTRLATHLAMEQLKRGASLVFIDGKERSVRAVLAAVEAVQGEKFQKADITLALPSQHHPPAWNPLDARAQGSTAEQVSNAFLSVIKAVRGDDKPSRWPDILLNALILTSAHSLSLYETTELLINPDYLKGLLRQPLEDPTLVNERTFREVQRYFRIEFPAFTKGGNLIDLLPVTTRLREIRRNPYLFGMMCSQKPSFDIRSLWKEQKVLLVALEDGQLGDESASLLGGLLITQLINTAMRVGGQPGGHDVVLFLDEIAFTQHYLGKNAGKIIGMGRQYDLNWVAGCQYLGKINPDLRADLLSVSTHAYFRLEDSDAEAVAKVAALGSTEPPPKQVKISVADRRAGEIDVERAHYRIHDSKKRVLSLRQSAYEVLLELPQAKQVKGLELLMHDSGLDPLAFITAGGTLRELAKVLKGVPESDWRIGGPDPMRLLVQFPRPKATVVRGTSEHRGNWEHRLQNLPEQTMVLRSPMSSELREVRVAHIELPPLSTALLQAVLSKGQSAEEIAAMEEWREEQRARIEAPPPSPEPRPTHPTYPTPVKKTKLPAAAQPDAGWGIDDAL